MSNKGSLATLYHLICHIKFVWVNLKIFSPNFLEPPAELVQYLKLEDKRKTSQILDAVGDGSCRQGGLGGANDGDFCIGCRTS